MKERWAIPRSWIWVQASDVSDVVGGGTPSTTDERNWVDGDIPWITPADLSGYRAKTISRGLRSITRAGLDRSGARLMPAGTVLMSSRAPIGYVAVASDEVCTNQGFKSFVLQNGVSSDFLYYYLQAGREVVLSLASGTTFLEISGKNAALIPIPLPPLAEQHRIVAEIEKHLTRLDAAVAALQRARANLKRYRAAVLKAAVEGRLVPTEGYWDFRKVGDLAKRIQYGSSAKTRADPNGVPVLRMGNIQDGRLVFDDLKYLPENHAEFPELLLSSGDMLFNRTNSFELVGKSAVYKGRPARCSFASYLIRVQLSDNYSPDLLAIYLNSAHGRGWIKAVVNQQVGQANVNGSKLRDLLVPVPPLAEQQRIVAEVDRRLSVVEVLEAAVGNGLKRAARLRQSVLKRAFEGRLVPQDPDDEPASVVLDRIRAERASEAAKPARGGRARVQRAAQGALL